MYWKHGIASLAAVLLAFAAGAVSAQERERDQDEQDRPRAGAARQDTQTQDRPRVGAQRTERQDQADRQERAGAEGRTREGRQGQGGQQLEQQLAAMLALGNFKEIQLSQVAAEKAQNPQVKEFAQKMVQDHSQFLQKLQQFMPPGQLESLQTSPGRTGAGAAGARTTEDRDATVRTTEQPEGAIRSAEDREGRQTRPGQEGAVAGRQQRGQAHGPMLQIATDATQRCIQLTRELWEQKQGAEFDKAYMGQQIVAHIDELSKLTAMQNHGSQEFQQVVRQGAQTTEQHLKEARNIIQSLEQDQGGRTGARTQPDANNVRRPAQP